MEQTKKNEELNNNIIMGIPIDNWIKYILLPLFIFTGFIFRFWAIDFGYPNTKSRPDEDFIMRVVVGFFERGDIAPVHSNQLFNNYKDLLDLMKDGKATDKDIAMFGNLLMSIQQSDQKSGSSYNDVLMGASIDLKSKKFDFFADKNNYNKLIELGENNLRPLFFNYPTLFLYLMAFVYEIYYLIGAIFGSFPTFQSFLEKMKDDGLIFYQLLRIMSALMGTITIYFVYLAGKRLFNKYIGIFSTMIFSVILLHIRDSHFGVTDVPVTLFIAICFYYSVRIYQEGTLKNVILASIFGGLGMSTKYNACIIFVPIILALLFNYLEASKKDKSLTVKHFIKYSAISTVIFGVAFFAFSPYILIKFNEFINSIFEIFKYVTKNTPTEQQQFKDADIGWFFHLKHSFWYGLGFLVTITSISGIIACFIPATKRTLLLLSFPVLYYLIVGKGNEAIHARYVVAISPFMAMFAGFFIYYILEKLKYDEKKKFLVGISATIVIMLPVLFNTVGFIGVLSKDDTRNEAMEWIKKNAPEGSGFLLGINQNFVPIYDYGNPNPLNYFKADFDYTKWHFYKYNPVQQSGNRNAPLQQVIYDYNDQRSMLLNMPSYTFKPTYDDAEIKNNLYSWMKQVNIQYIIVNRHFLENYSCMIFSEVNDLIKNNCELVASFQPFDTEIVKSVPHKTFQRTNTGIQPVVIPDIISKGTSEPHYEIRDAFYVPFANFSGIKKMGSIIEIYKIRNL